MKGQHVKLVKLNGEFVWHKHEHEDEFFYVLKGTLKIEFRDKKIELKPNECLIVPKSIEHRPVADTEVSLILFEPAGTLNTGDTRNEFTKEKLKNI